jgi:hypothetical protein
MSSFMLDETLNYSNFQIFLNSLKQELISIHFPHNYSYYF